MEECKITTKFIEDKEIDIKHIDRRFKKISEEIKSTNKENFTDINIICEEIFAQILNKIYDLSLVPVSLIHSGNFVSVDLIDYNKKIAFQVTSRSDKRKIKNTIDKFNRAKVLKEIQMLNILILSSDEHKYIGDDIVELKNGFSFSYSKNILNFNTLVRDIEKKQKNDHNIIVEIYDMVSMIYDTGRIYYKSIVKETENLNQNIFYTDDRTCLWNKGYGDIHLSAFIPTQYDKQLCCMLQIRKYSLLDCYITLEQKKLINDYLVEQEEFEKKHSVGRYCGEDEMFLQIEDIRLKMNAHTAYHVYKLFDELKKEYMKSKNKIEITLGVVGMKKNEYGYLLMSIDRQIWNDIMVFASEHDYMQVNGENEWNIFNNVNKNSIILTTNINSSIKSDVVAEIKVRESEISSDELDLYWLPGFKYNVDSMEGFDNLVKWKADYTKKWIQNKLIRKIKEDSEKNKKRSYWFSKWFKL